MIDDIGPGCRQGDRGHSLASGGERVVAERRGMRGRPNQREPHAGVTGLAQGFGGCARHRDRPRRAIGFDQDRGGRLGADRHRGPRVHVAGFDQIDVARDPHDAVRVHAPEIRPDEDLGDDRRIGFGHAGSREDVRREALERVGRGGRRRLVQLCLAHSGIRPARENIWRANCARGRPPAYSLPRT